jgi:hypothetical protein
VDASPENSDVLLYVRIMAWARPIRGISAITLAVIAVVVLASVVFLLVPIGLGEGTRARGEFLSPLLGASALLVSGVALVASIRTAGASFRAEEKVKEDVATLLTALRNLRLRLRLSPYLFDTSHEALLDQIGEQRAAINSIFNSTTGYAFAALEGERSREAGEGPAEWGVLPIYLLEILQSVRPEIVFVRALAFERLLETLTIRDIRRLAGYVSDLTESTVLFGKSYGVLDEIDKATGEEKMESSSDERLERFRRIKASGVDDPDVDMFIAVLEGDGSVDDLKDALDRGANPSITDTEVLRRHEAV